MKINLIILMISSLFCISTDFQNTDNILKKVDQNMYSKNRIFESSMIIHGKRMSRTIKSKTWSVDYNKSFTEYLSPERERGTKMLKLEDHLWIYSPSTDRTIQISGHMLRQSLMGSDLSYEDMMENRELTEMYNATVTEKTTIFSRECWILLLTAKVDDVAYKKRKIWIDTERYVPLQEELYAKSGQLLKRTILEDFKQIDNRWFPTTITYKDILKKGDGTVFKISNISFDQEIPKYIFTKAALKQ